MDWAKSIIDEAIGGEGYALIHELSLYAWNVDGNLVPYGLDVLLLGGRLSGALARAGWSEGRSQAGDVYLERLCGGYVLRAWETLEGRAACDFALYENVRWGRKTLSPRDVLDTLPLSPDYPYLVEQRAALAMILFHGDMDDDELGLFARYVRI